jgi:hypothetical protein
VQTDIFGETDTKDMFFNGDLNLSLTTPSGKAKMIAGKSGAAQKLHEIPDKPQGIRRCQSRRSQP